ncbi:MAG: MFS transporter [Clostridiales bacterium]|nr:MFS transporter [Clostridiales bacterium]
MDKKAKEIAKRQKQLNAHRSSFYLVYLFFIISIIYITDEVASQMAAFMKTEIANDMLAKFGEASVSRLDIITFVSFPFMALGILYKPLADRFGRKPFLIINTFGMCLGLLIIYLTESVFGYIVGSCLVQFFVAHDMQVVYIMESAPDKHRAKIYSSIKCIAMLGVLLIPLLRKLLMSDVSQWRRVYLLPGIAGMLVSIAAIFLTKETDAYNISRINILEGKACETENKSGSVIQALRFVWKHKQLRFIFLALVFSETGFVFTIDYQVIMSYGYAGFSLANGLASSLESALQSVGINEVTTALFFFPIGCALSTLATGFISDKFGRRISAVVMSGSAALFFLAFFLGSNKGLSPQAVGFLCGASVGTFWSNIDTICLMAGESTPTALRSSVLAASFLATGLGIGISFMVSVPLLSVFGNSSIGWVSFALTVPGLVADFFILIFKVKETTGVDLVTIQGSEFE